MKRKMQQKNIVYYKEKYVPVQESSRGIYFARHLEQATLSPFDQNTDQRGSYEPR